MLREFRYAVRHLTRAPRFSILAIATLGLALAGTSALLSILNALVLRKVGGPEPDRLAVVTVANDRGQQGFVALSAFEELARGQDVFETMSGTTGVVPSRVEIDGAITTIARESVTGSYHQMLGARTIVGRSISEDDDQQARPVVVISHGFWMTRFAGNPAIVGQPLRVERVPLTIIGVTAPEASSIGIDQEPEIVLPLRLMARLLNAPAASFPYYLVGRLRPGITLAAAEARLQLLWPEIVKATLTGPDQPRRRAMRGMEALGVASGAHGVSTLRKNYVRPLSLLLGLAVIVLAVACLNVGGLHLARMVSREGEFGVRLALGATRRDISRQLLAEGLLLSLAATVLAVPMSLSMIRSLVAMLWIGPLPLTVRLTPDGRVIAVMAIAALVCATIVSLPAVAFWRLRERQLGGRPSRTVLAGTSRTGKALIVVQMALSLALLFEAGLFTWQLLQLRAVDPGYRVDGVFLARPTAAPGVTPPAPDAATASAKTLLERLAALEGVDTVALSVQFPTVNPERAALAPVRLASAADETGARSALIDFVSTDFFTLTGIPTIEGRVFTWQDDDVHPQVAIINATLARQLAGSRRAIGTQFCIGPDADAKAVEVVGVVRDASPGDVRLAGMPIIYRPIFQERTYLRSAFVTLHARDSGRPPKKNVRRTFGGLGN